MAQPSAASAPTREQRLAMTYDEYLTWARDDVQAEWVDGEVTVFTPPTKIHQRTMFFLASLLSWHTDALGLGEVIVAPFEMRLWPGRSSRQPDILFVAREHGDRSGPNRVDGPADLVVELVSDESVTRDQVEKFNEYAAAGVPKYWLFDPRPGQRRSAFFRLGDDGRYEAVPLDADGRYHAAVLPGFWLRPDWLWRTPLPDPMACLMEIAPDAERAAPSGDADGV